MKGIFLWFVRLTGLVPEILFFKRKTYYADRREQGRRIKGGAIIVSNHTSLLDFAMLIFVFPLRTLHFLMAEVLYKNPLCAWFASAIGGVYVNRDSGDMNFMGPAVELLRKGRVLGIFPESRISEDGRVGEFKPSAAYIALKSGAPIIPVYCKKSYGIFKRAKVVIGEKIYLKDICGGDEEPSLDKLKELSLLLRRRVLELKGLMEVREKTGVTGALNLKWFPYDMLRITSWPLIRIGFLPRIYGANGERPNTRIRGGAMVVTNHTSLFDPAIIVNLFTSRRVFFIAAEVLFQQGFMLRWFMHLIGAIRVNREAAIDMESFNRSVDVLRAGGVVGIFPEGRLSRSNDLLPFKSGAILMALTAKKPIIPVYRAQTPRIFHRHDIIIGKPFDPSAYLKGPMSIARIEEISGLLQQEMLSLKAELEARMSGGNINKCKNNDSEADEEWKTTYDSGNSWTRRRANGS